MKNIYILSTEIPSRLTRIYNDVNKENFTLKLDVEVNDSFKEHINIYITSDEEIKEGNWVLGNYPDNPIGKVISKYGEEFTMQSLNNDKHGLAQYDSKKIILTTDQDLIKDGVQKIDDEFLEWFGNNPSCEEIEVFDIRDLGLSVSYKIIIPKEEPEQETLEDLLNKKANTNVGIDLNAYANGLEDGAKWMQERMYSEDEVLNFAQIVISQYKFGNTNIEQIDLLKNTLNAFKEALDAARNFTK